MKAVQVKSHSTLPKNPYSRKNKNPMQLSQNLS